MNCCLLSSTQKREYSNFYNFTVIKKYLILKNKQQQQQIADADKYTIGIQNQIFAIKDVVVKCCSLETEIFNDTGKVKTQRGSYKFKNIYLDIYSYNNNNHLYMKKRGTRDDGEKLTLTNTPSNKFILFLKISYFGSVLIHFSV